MQKQLIVVVLVVLLVINNDSVANAGVPPMPPLLNSPQGPPQIERTTGRVTTEQSTGCATGGGGVGGAGSTTVADGITTVLADGTTNVLADGTTTVVDGRDALQEDYVECHGLKWYSIETTSYQVPGELCHSLTEAISSSWDPADWGTSTYYQMIVAVVFPLVIL